MLQLRFAGLVMSGAVLLCTTGTAAQIWTDAEQLAFLRTAEVVSAESLGTGTTHSLRATLRNGSRSHDVQIQSINELWAPGEAFDSYKHNLAAYELSRILQLQVIPATAERVYQGKPSSFTWWVDDVKMTEAQRQAKTERPPDAAPWNRQVFLMKVFDALIHNTDRNMGNVLIDGNWRIWMIDHTRAFSTQKELEEQEGLTRCDRLLLERIGELDRSKLSERLSRWLTIEQFDALIARRNLIAQHFQKLAAEKGEAAVFYEYLGKE